MIRPNSNRHYSNCCSRSALESLAQALVSGLRAELDLTPKPGLVDRLNNGSHSDLTPALMDLSIDLLADYLEQICPLIAAGSPITALIPLGQQAEQRMYAATGTNCHKGGIFLCSLLLCALAALPEGADETALQRSVAAVAGDFFRVRQAHASHGNRVRQQHPRAGIVAEALDGLPSLFQTFLPAMRETSVAQNKRPFLAMARLMQQLEDSTSLHRCGQPGLAQLKQSGATLEHCILSGCDPESLLLQQDQEFQQANLTMGGVADILGLGLGYHQFSCHNIAD